MMSSSTEMSSMWDSNDSASSGNNATKSTRNKVRNKKKISVILDGISADDNISTSSTIVSDKQNKKRKRKNSDLKSPKKKKIKVESESELESAKIKKTKYKNNQDSDNDSYLEHRVKKEKLALQLDQMAVKEELLRSVASDRESFDGHDNRKKKKSKRHKTEDHDDTNEPDQGNEVNKQEESDTVDEERKKKRKRKKNKDVHELKVEDQFSADETVIQDSRNMDQEDTELALNSTCYGSDHKDNGIVKVKVKRKTKDKKSVNGDLDQSQNGAEVVTLQTSTRAPRISERFAFEDEPEPSQPMPSQPAPSQPTPSQPMPSQPAPSQPSLLKRYLQKHPALTVASNVPINDDLTITENDDVWLLKCSSEVTASSFTDITLGDKCKIKVHGSSYDGSIDKTCERLALVSYEGENGKCKIANIKIQGVVHFRRRIPKAHTVEHGVMENNRCNFIPLPETKLRHPLFGANYKDLVKIPAAVAARLRGEGGECEVREARRARRRQREQTAPVAADEPDAPAPADGGGARRKRRHSRAAGAEPETERAPRKRVKRDTDAPAAWDSERAIEENLFNF